MLGGKRLTTAAMAMIEDDRNGPQLADTDYDDEDGEEATFGSRTALPVPRPAGVRGWLRRGAGTRPGGR